MMRYFWPIVGTALVIPLPFIINADALQRGLLAGFLACLAIGAWVRAIRRSRQA